MTSHFVTTCIVAAGSLNFIRLLNNKKNINNNLYSAIQLLFHSALQLSG